MEKTFNLTDNPWILVRKRDESVIEVSLKEVLLNCQDYLGLAGETATQDAVLLRIIEAIFHKMVSEYDSEGNYEPIMDDREALDRWEYVWEKGRLPEEPVLKYLTENYDDFWLIDDKNPFMQAPAAKIGTLYGASKLVGDISESSNKLRLFNQRALEEKQSVAYPEAARWLLNLNAYDDTSAKRKGGGKEAPGAGWLGKIGQIYAQGENLFQTLMLNCILVHDEDQIYPPDHFSWESPQSRWQERHHVPQPDNFGELMTLRSRLILLQSDGKRVTGYRLLGGEFFDRTNSFIEPFTVWRTVKGKKNEPDSYTPKRHSESRQLWRDFSSIVNPSTETGTVQPGIVQWISLLQKEELLPENYPIVLTAPYATYGDKDFFINNLSTQNLRIYTSLLTSAGQVWIHEIERQIQNIDKLASCAGYFFQNIAQASGASGDALKPYWEKGAASIYALIDQPFSSWIAGLTPENSASAGVLEEKKQEWINTAARIATDFRTLETARNLGNDAGALFGRIVTGKNDQEEQVSVLTADIQFAHQIRKIYGSVDMYEQKDKKKNGKETNV